MFYKENKSRYSCSDSYLLKVFLIPSTAPLTPSLTFSNTSLAFAKFFSTVPSVSVLCSPVTFPNNSFAAPDAYRTYSCNLSNKKGTVLQYLAKASISLTVIKGVL